MSLGCVALGLASFGLSASRVNDTNVSSFLSSTALIVYASIVLAKEYKKERLISPLSMYSFLMLIHFGFPGLLAALGVSTFVNNDNSVFMTHALIFVIISFASFHAGCLLITRCKRMGIRNKEGFWSTDKTWIVVGGLILVGWLARYIVAAQGLYFQINRGDQGGLEGPFFAVIMFAEMIPLQAIIIVLIHRYTSILDPGISRRFKIFLTILIISELIYWLPTGRKENVILVLVLPIIVVYAFSTKLPSKWTLFGIAAFIISLFPITFYYRYAMEVHQFSSMSMTESIAQSITAVFSGDPVEGSGFIILISRINLLESVSACIRLVETGLWDLSCGKDYLMIAVNQIPRLIWPEKPGFHYGTVFGQEAGFIDFTDTTTSVSVTFFGEAYLNFAWFGVFVIFVFGIFFTWLYQKAVRSLNPTMILLYMITVPVILYIGGTVALYFGGLAKGLIFYYLLGTFMSISLNKLLMRKLN